MVDVDFHHLIKCNRHWSVIFFYHHHVSCIIKAVDGAKVGHTVVYSHSEFVIFKKNY